MPYTGNQKTPCSSMNRTEVFDEAKQLEAKTGKPHYIVHCFDDTWIVDDKMPLLGEWYTTDSIRHG